MKQTSNRNGHAPGHIRDAFIEWVEAKNRPSFVKVGWEQTEQPIEWLFSQLKDCTDIFPGIDCDILEIEQGSTFSCAVKKAAALA